jgi:hypothetical protein
VWAYVQGGEEVAGQPDSQRAALADRRGECVGWTVLVGVVSTTRIRSAPNGFSQSLRWKGVNSAAFGFSFFCSCRDRVSRTTGSSSGGSGSAFFPSNLLRSVRWPSCCVGPNSLPDSSVTGLMLLVRGAVEMLLAWLKHDPRRRVHWPGISVEVRIRKCREESLAGFRRDGSSLGSYR